MHDIYAALANQGGGLSGRLSRLKQTIFQGMLIAAKNQLKRKIAEEGWSKGVTWEWVELTSTLKKKWCNGVARFTVLRWAVNQDDDIWLATRGTRHGQQGSHCSSKGDSFPSGYTVAPMCEQCIHTHRITPVTHCPFGTDLLRACQLHFHGSHAPGVLSPSVSNGSTSMSQFQVVGCRPDGVCLACGCGDNTIGHWTRWCIIPFTGVWVILQPATSVHCLSDLAILSPTANAICTLTCIPKITQTRRCFLPSNSQ